MHSLASLLLIAFGVATASAYANFCSLGDARVVRRQWQDALGGSEGARSRLIGGAVVFDAMFATDPATKALFGRVNVADIHSAEFKSHVVRVMTGLDICINALEDPPLLKQLTSHLAQQHVVREGVKAQHLRMMGNLLLGAMPQLVADFNPDAWAACLVPVLSAMSAGLP